MHSWWVSGLEFFRFLVRWPIFSGANTVSSKVRVVGKYNVELMELVHHGISLIHWILEHVLYDV